MCILYTKKKFVGDSGMCEVKCVYSIHKLYPRAFSRQNLSCTELQVQTELSTCSKLKLSPFLSHKPPPAHIFNMPSSLDTPLAANEGTLEPPSSISAPVLTNAQLSSNQDPAATYFTKSSVQSLNKVPVQPVLTSSGTTPIRS